MGASRIFISYSHKDEPYVRALARRIEGAGLEPWYFTESQSAGIHWPQRLLDVVSQASAVLVVISRASNSPDAEYVHSEVLLAQRERRAIIPLKIEQCSGPLDLMLAARNWINAWDGGDPLPRILAALPAHEVAGPAGLGADFALLTVDPAFRAHTGQRTLSLALPSSAALTEPGEPLTLCRIGRDPRGDLVFAATLTFVSRQHARVCALRGERGVSFMLFDDQSRHGTFVNGAPIAGSHTLSDGDRIGLGMARAMLHFEWVAPTGERVEGWEIG